MKKLLSIILATAILISLVPAVFADTTESAIPSNLVRAYNFDFGAAGYGSDTEIAPAKLAEFGDTDSTPTDIADIQSELIWADKNGTDKWIIDGHYRCNDGATSSAPALTASTTTNSNRQPNALYWTTYSSRFPSGAGIVIQVEITEPGEYIPQFTYYGRSDLAKYKVYLTQYNHLQATHRNRFGFKSSNIAGSVKEALAEGSALLNTDKDPTYLGTLDMYSPSSDVCTKSLDTKYEVTESELNKYGTQFCLFIYLDGKGQAASESTQHVNLFSFELYEEAPVVEEPTEQEKAEAEFVPSTDDSYEAAPASATVNTLALYGEASEAIGTETVTYGETATIDAVPATVTKADGTYNFLYWAKGLEEGVSKQILSTSNAAFAYKPHEGANYLIAVYEKEGEANEAFYNNNGQLLTDLKIVDGVLPALPAMAGRGNAAAWVQRGTNDEFAGGAAAPTSGDMVFMAKYEEVEDNITINGESYSYGDIVSCKDIVAGMDNFSYFTRKIGDADAEIISIDADYSFAAYTDCTIEAVCNGAVTLVSPKKIALSTFSVGDKLTAVMAEFIGFGDAKEKGIMFGGKKIAMTTDKAQFTVTNDTDVNVEVTGYAIVGDDKYVDGEITVDAAK